MGKHEKKSKSHKSEKHKKDKKKHKKRHYSSSSSDSSTGDEWVEKETTPKQKFEEPKQREDWFSLPANFTTISNHDRRRERELNKRNEKEEDKYNPSKNVRELNPYWKDGGDGLPSEFKKPSNDDFDIESTSSHKHKSVSSSNWRKPKNDLNEHNHKSASSSNWRKKKDQSSVTLKNESDNRRSSPEMNEDNTINEETKILSDKELNALAAKLVKAEIMGNTKLIEELKNKLEIARKLRECGVKEDHEVILTRTDSKGFARPVKMQSDYKDTSKKKKQKVETHSDSGDRMRYFADDDNYSLKQMFENEKFNSAEEQNNQFAKLAGKIRKNDDMDEIFADNIRNKESDAKVDKRNTDRAIDEHQRMTKSLDTCSKCLQSTNMLKHLMVSMGETIYLSLPSYEPLTEGHCLLIPLRHVISCTQLDENEFSELMNFRKMLTKMYLDDGDDVIFFETAMFFNSHPHMVINCIPLPKEEGDMAPIYFKKAIDESETEWATNKKLISLAGKNICKVVPKGLPYFSVSFGMTEGYAHIIEDQENFPKNFAHEIIGGMLDLHHSKWRKPKRQTFDEQSKRVLEFSKKWKEYDTSLTKY
ncbi:PREDICTED: CWF19-like protein 2 homolog [Nicrophorus vespilloides]|uniref:CWF19-like protein 2 homolog n=1 Tax=Nicrophorus vespilloides TaxID=110193 RepID=A0ABM1NA96_NICVS|nr:PREDICTED: CWF19-like protein 2 homolog [Nicrophorus vespilloides]